MSGRVGDLSASQQAALEQLKVRVKDVSTPTCTDSFLLRFLRSRGFDLDKTEKKLRATLEFRKKWGADTILKDWTPPPLCLKYFPSGALGGVSKNGLPCPVLALGNIDMKGLMKCHSKDDLIKFKVYEMELMDAIFKELSQKEGKIIDSVDAIIDMHGLSAYHLWGPGIVLFSEFMQIEEMHYPEIVHKGFFIRCPRIFPTVYALVKPFVDPNTREKLDALGGNWQTKLQEVFPADILPEVYGGSAKNTGNVCWAGRVPKEFYKENDEKLQHQYVKPGKKFLVEVQTSKPKMELSWEFITENHDIGFAVFFQNEAGEHDEIVPSERLAAHHGNIEGSYLCEKVGLYILEWDNSFSWTRGKNLRYKYDIAEGVTAPEMAADRNASHSTVAEPAAVPAAAPEKGKEKENGDAARPKEEDAKAETGSVSSSSSSSDAGSD